MLKKSTMAIGISLVSLLVGGVHAENGYFGGNIAFVEYSEEGIGDDASLNAIFGRIGKKFNENFSGEIRVGIGIGDDTVDLFGGDVDVELDSLFGVYVRGGIQVAESFYPYAVLGYTRGELTASVSGFGSASESESDISFGVGADVGISEKVILNVEYMNYLDKDGAEIDGFSIGIATNF